MGKSSFHKHMFFKFQSSQTQLIPYYRKVIVFTVFCVRIVVLQSAGWHYGICTVEGYSSSRVT